MSFRKDEFLVKHETSEQVKIMLQEFENKYQSFESRWDYELISQKENQTVVQLVDRSFETPRGKGQSDCPSFHIRLSDGDQGTRIRWHFVWKHNKSVLSWLVSALLLATGILVLTAVRGDKLVLYSAIWAFWASLYGALLLEHFLHDRMTTDTFRKILRQNFGEQDDEPLQASNTEQ